MAPQAELLEIADSRIASKIRRSMQMMSLIPGDQLTERLLADVIAAMIKHEIMTKGAAAPSEFPRPDVAAAGTQSAQTVAQPDSTIVLISGQNDGKAVVVTQTSEIS